MIERILLKSRSSSGFMEMDDELNKVDYLMSFNKFLA